MEDVKFHQCVRLARFENDRTISFIPPDGEFELMSYRLNTQVKPLIWVECIVESHSGSRIEYMLKARAQFKRRSTANNVEISIPVPEDADTPRFRTNVGTVHYAPERSAIVWKIKQFGGQKEFLMRAELGLPSVRGDDEKGGGMMGGFGGSLGGVNAKSKRPINVKFEIPYFTTSGIQVRYLKIIEPKVCEVKRTGRVENVWLMILSSCNTRRCRGLDILRSRATLRLGCRMLRNNEYHVDGGNSSDLFSLSLLFFLLLLARVSPRPATSIFTYSCVVHLWLYDVPPIHLRRPLTSDL
jgi:hypothetical protein